MAIGTKIWIGGLVALGAVVSLNALAQPYPGPPPSARVVQKFSTADLKDGPLDEAQMKAAIDYIEGHVQMPDGAKPLDQYARYYAQDPDKGFIHAVYTLPMDSKEAAASHIVAYDKLPVIMDGGCSVIDVTFIRKIHALRAACHGLA